jgi:hypothetical protein
MRQSCRSRQVQVKTGRCQLQLAVSVPGAITHTGGDTLPSPFSSFPSEIVCFIVRHAAAICPQTTLTLTLVSKTVREWIEPVLYHTVTLWTPHTLDLFRIAFDAKPRSFFAAHVRNLFINGEDGSDIIMACSNVERLASYPPALVGLPDFDVQEDTPSSTAASSSLPQSSADTGCPTPGEVMLVGALDDVPWASPLFRNVKYLYLGLEPPPPETACDVSLLPSLTHCAFPYDGDEDDALILTISTLLESSTLTHLVVLVNDEQGNPDRDRKGTIWTKLACMTDSRLLVGTELCHDGDDWEAMVEAGTTMWDSWDRDYSGWRCGLP